MKTKRFFFSLIAALLMAALMPMSSHAGADSEWIAKSEGSTRPNTGDQIMVVGMTSDMEQRELFEKILSEQFSHEGVNAAASLSMVDEAAPMDKTTLFETAGKKGMDYVLISTVKDVETAYSSFPYDPGLNYLGLGGSYAGELNTDQKRYVKAHYPEWAHVQLRSVIYSTRTGNIVWTGTSETTQPVDTISPQSVVDSVSNILVKAVAGSGNRSS